ncbi:ATP synthase subunit I [Methylocystis sp. JAN1]|uniref:N-ATPase subunit AtpR n=1 Tax=Methylocystis sp. JAN1 TaxID=3397211 RepID=UPI003FA225D4
MTASAPLSSLALQLCGGGLVGAIVGYGYFTALWWNVLLIDRGATARALLLLAARVTALVLTLFILVRVGALALLAGAAGLLAARRILVRRLGRPS